MAWPLIHRWSSWPSGLTTAYSGLEWPTTVLQAARQASPASFSTRGLLLPPPPPPPWQGQVLERGVRLKEGEGKELPFSVSTIRLAAPIQLFRSQ